jgi:hypothetical protein
MPVACAASLGNLRTVPQALLTASIARLDAERIDAICRAANAPSVGRRSARWPDAAAMAEALVRSGDHRDPPPRHETAVAVHGRQPHSIGRTTHLTAVPAEAAAGPEDLTGDVEILRPEILAALGNRWESNALPLGGNP